MAIKMQSPPESHSAVLARTMENLLDRHLPSRALFRGRVTWEADENGAPGPAPDVLESAVGVAKGGATEVSVKALAPLPVYVLGLDAARNGALEQATPYGWRYIVSDGERSDTVDFRAPEGVDPVFTDRRFNAGADLTAVARLGEEIVSDSAEDFEARILEIAPLHMSALWLQNQNNRQDNRFVIIGAPGAKPLEADDFVARMRAAAAKDEIRKGGAEPEGKLMKGG
jgi:hypothetical protein